MEFAAVYFSKTAIRQVRHQREAPRHQIRRLHAPTIIPRRLADAAREQRAEAAKTGEADFHTHTSNRPSLRREQLLGAIEAHLNSILVWRDAEQRLELPDKVIGRNPHFARERFDGRLWVVELRQQLACSAESAKTVVSHQHGGNLRRMATITLAQDHRPSRVRAKRRDDAADDVRVAQDPVMS